MRSETWELPAILSFQEKCQTQYSYTIDKEKGLFTTIGIALPSDEEDDESLFEEGGEDEDKDEEAEGLNSNSRSLQREQDDDGGDQLQALEDQVRRLSINDTAGLKATIDRGSP